MDKKEIKISKKKTFRTLNVDFFIMPPELNKNSKFKKIVKINASLKINTHK